MRADRSSEGTPAINQSEKWEKKKLGVLLKAASIAIKRARYVFIAINIGAILVFSAEFNALFPWIRNALARTSIKPDVKAVLNEILHKELQIVSAPLLGIKFSAFDLTVLGSIAALLLAIWFYYCVRREYLVVNEVYKIAKDSPNAQKRAYLYHGIAHYFVYTTASKREEPEGITTQATARAVVKALFFVPAWLPLLIVVSDIISLVLPSEASDEPGCKTLWCVLERNGQLVEAIGRMLFAVILSIFSFFQCLGAYKWDRATRNLVETLQKKVKDDTAQTKKA